MPSYLFFQYTSISFCLWYFISTYLSQHFISVLFSWISVMELLPFFTYFHFILPFLLFFILYLLSSYFSVPFPFLPSTQLFIYTSFSFWMTPLLFFFPLAAQPEFSQLCFLPKPSFVWFYAYRNILKCTKMEGSS